MDGYLDIFSILPAASTTGSLIWHRHHRTVGIGSWMGELSLQWSSMPAAAVMAIRSGTIIKGLFAGFWVYFSKIFSILRDRISTGQAIDGVLIYPIGTTVRFCRVAIIEVLRLPHC